MARALLVAALATASWLFFGAGDASWARQEPAKAQAEQREVSEKVRLLSPGTEITVFLKGRSKLEGVLREVQDDAIVVDHRKGGGSTRVMLADIERLQIRERGLHPVTVVIISAAAAIGTLLVLAVAAC